MSNIMLVIGSVTSKQCNAARIDLLRDGIKPKIRRIPSSVIDEVRDALNQRRYGVTDDLDQTMRSERNFIIKTYERLLGVALTDIGAVVFAGDAYDDDDPGLELDEYVPDSTRSYIWDETWLRPLSF